MKNRSNQNCIVIIFCLQSHKNTLTHKIDIQCFNTTKENADRKWNKCGTHLFLPLLMQVSKQNIFLFRDDDWNVRENYVYIQSTNWLWMTVYVKYSKVYKVNRPYFVPTVCQRWANKRMVVAMRSGCHFLCWTMRNFARCGTAGPSEIH